MDILFGREQLPVLAAFLVIGVSLGLLWDLFAVKRKIFGAWPPVVFVDDLLWCFCALLLIEGFAYCFNNGNLRWYELPAMTLSFALYRKTLSPVLLRLFDAVLVVLRRTFRFVLTPFRRLFAALSLVIVRFSRNVARRQYEMHRVRAFSVLPPLKPPAAVPDS